MFVFHFQDSRWVLFLVGITIVFATAFMPSCLVFEDKALPIIQSLNEQTPATGPLRVNPLNSRYFIDNAGKTIYLTGSHTWANFQDIGYSNPPPVFDYNAYLDFLRINNHNFFRLWEWEQSMGAPWSTEIWINPLPYQRSGSGTALDGQPKFDLTKFDQSYFDRLRNRVVLAGEQGIYVSIMLFDGFSVGKKNSGDSGSPWIGHPFNVENNINGINGDPNNDGNGYETQTLSIPEITALQDAYVRKVIDTVNDLDNVLYEICNECNQDSTSWQYHMIDYVHEYEMTLPKQHPVGMTVEYPDGSNEDLFDSPADWISPNAYFDPPPSDGSKVIIADTDHIWGIGGDRQWVWKSFTRGIHPIFMDCYNANYCEGENPNKSAWVSLRLNMGYTLAYANHMNLAVMVPRSDLCSTGYCLANPVEEGAEYLVYIPNGGSVSVDLSNSPVNLSVEWFNPQKGTQIAAPTVTGGDTQTFFAPFSNDAVLYIHNVDSFSPTSTMTDTPISHTSTQIKVGTTMPASQTLLAYPSTTSTPVPPTSTMTFTHISPTSIKTMTSTIPVATQTVLTNISPSPTSMPPNASLPCAQGFLGLSGLLLGIVVWIGSNTKRKIDF